MSTDQTSPSRFASSKARVRSALKLLLRSGGRRCVEMLSTQRSGARLRRFASMEASLTACSQRFLDGG